MKKFLKRVLISPALIILVIVSIICWLIDLFIGWLIFGNMSSDLRERWEKNEILNTILDRLLIWSEHGENPL